MAKLMEMNWNPGTRQLRQFGTIAAVMLPLIAYVWGGSLLTMGVFAAAGLLLAILAWSMPRLVRPIYVVISAITFPIGLVMGELALLLLFFGIVTPLALMFRVLSRDTLRRRRPNADSYWTEKKQPESTASYFRQS